MSDELPSRGGVSDQLPSPNRGGVPDEAPNRGEVPPVNGGVVMRRMSNAERSQKKRLSREICDILNGSDVDDNIKARIEGEVEIAAANQTIKSFELW